MTCLNEWLSTEENRWYEPNTSVTLQKIEYQRYLEITIGIPHNSFVFFSHVVIVVERCANSNLAIGRTGAFAIPARLLSTSQPIIIADNLAYSVFSRICPSPLLMSRILPTYQCHRILSWQAERVDIWRRTLLLQTQNQGSLSPCSASCLPLKSARLYFAYAKARATKGHSRRPAQKVKDDANPDVCHDLCCISHFLTFLTPLCSGTGCPTDVFFILTKYLPHRRLPFMDIFWF